MIVRVPRGAPRRVGRWLLLLSALPSAAHAQEKPSAPLEISVRGASRASSLRRSANAVSVVELEAAKQQSADLGEVLARESAVTVQRGGGLGSRGSFSLGGLGGQRLRFFLDGVPLDLMGYVAGIQNVPVNLIERVEVYQGVVPTRFGADALGGAVQLVSDENVRKSRVSASYQVGDFGVHRFTGMARYFDRNRRVFVKSAVFLDAAKNDFPMDVSVSDALGRPVRVTLPRFHDGYRAHGSTLGVGVVDQPWADRLVVQGFFAAFENDVQHGFDLRLNEDGTTSTSPYGEVTFERRTAGVNAKYAISGENTRLDAVFGYARLDSEFLDVSSCFYDWYGRCRPRTVPGVRGEVSPSVPSDIALHTDSFFLRAELTQNLSDDHRLRFALAPTYADRSGKNHLRSAGGDALAQPRRLFTTVGGVELESTLFDERLRNIAFFKAYHYVNRSEALIATGDWVDMSKALFRVGGGDSLRVTLSRALYAKASYEYALRTPSTDELFGDGMLTLENLGLRPETSHNANLGVHLEDQETKLGAWRASLDGFGRWSNDMIALFTLNNTLSHTNVQKARALGVEAALGWTTPMQDWVSLEGRVTYQDLRNLSKDGPLSDVYWDRIPNIPYLLASGSLRLRGRALLTRSDVLDLAWSSRHVESFNRSWESRAKNVEKKRIPSQLGHTATLTYTFTASAVRLGTTFEVQNVTDAKLFDFYGIRRPGRAFFGKWTLDY